MATGATGTPTTNYSIPKYSTSADAPSGVGFNNAMDAIDTVIKTLDDAKIDAPASPADGDALVYDSGSGTWVAGTASNPSVTPIQLLNPLDGNAFWTVTALTAWSPGHWEFVKDVAGVIYAQVLVPAGVTAATIRLALGANATTGVTRIGLAHAEAADAESLNPASLTSLTSQDITVPATAYLRKDVTFSLTGLVGRDLLLLKVTHEGTHANDTLAVNTLLFGGWLEPA